LNVQKIHLYVAEQYALAAPAVDEVIKAAITRSATKEIYLKPLTIQLTNSLRGLAIKFLPFVDSTAQDPFDSPVLGGTCYAPKRGGVAPIELEIIVAQRKKLALTRSNWEVFRYTIHETLLHELVHRAQYALRKQQHSTLCFKTDKDNPEVHAEQEYLGSLDEVESYARDCVEYWNYVKPGVPITIRSLRAEFKQDSVIHAIEYYYEAYKDKKHPAVARFFRKVLQWRDVITPIAANFPPCPKSLQVYRKSYPVNVNAEHQSSAQRSI